MVFTCVFFWISLKSCIQIYRKHNIRMRYFKIQNHTSNSLSSREIPDLLFVFFIDGLVGVIVTFNPSISNPSRSSLTYFLWDKDVIISLLDFEYKEVLKLTHHWHLNLFHINFSNLWQRSLLIAQKIIFITINMYKKGCLYQFSK